MSGLFTKLVLNVWFLNCQVSLISVLDGKCGGNAPIFSPPDIHLLINLANSEYTP